MAAVAAPFPSKRLRAVLRAVDREVGPAGRAVWQRLAAAIVEPVARLETIAAVASDVAACDPSAARSLDRAIARLAALVPEDAFDLDDGLTEVSERRSRLDRAADDALIEPPALLAFAAAVTSIGLDARLDSSLDAPRALLPLIEAARPAELLTLAYERGGSEGAMQMLRGGGPGIGPDLQDIVDGMGFSGFPDLEFPDLGFPDIDIPGGPDLDDLLDPVPDWVDGLFGRYKPDPDEWEPIPWWWKFPRPHEAPPGYVELIRCTVKMRRLIAERAAIPPPPMPADAPYGITWADPITSLSADAHCPESPLKIFGAGFAELRDIAVVLIPTESGCRPVPVPPHFWRPGQITVYLPADVTSGPVGFGHKAYIAAYDAWHADQERRREEILALSCAALATVPRTSPFSACAPNLGRNLLRAGPAIIDRFRANGRERLVVAPGESLTLDWTARNCTSVQVARVTAQGPGFAGGGVIAAGATGAVTIGPFTASSPVDAVYELTATGPCGARTARVTVALRRTPRLTVTSVEFTQAIQTTGAAARSPLAAEKPTIARVTVTHDLQPFMIGGSYHVAVRGRLRIGSASVASINVGRAGPPGWANRTRTDDTLNFRIPPGLAKGAATAVIDVWSADEFEQPPGDTFLRARAAASAPVSWTSRRALRLRYVRVSTPIAGAPTDQECREIIVRGHDLLPTAPLDIAPARLATWHTSADVTTSDGKATLIDHLDDQHDCTTSEALFPWEEDCPDDDGAIWLGLFRPGGGGRAQGHRWWNISRNTMVAELDRIVVAHELGHTQKINHVNAGLGCPTLPKGDYDPLPLGGMISPGDAFDPHGGAVIPFGDGLWDMMTYGCNRWISPSNWQRLFDKFS